MPKLNHNFLKFQIEKHPTATITISARSYWKIFKVQMIGMFR
jgi:hypothetical protein